MLTTKQEKYVQNLVKGMSQRAAYKKAYNVKKMKDEYVDSKASTLFKQVKIKQRYEELVKKAEDKAIMSAKERMLWLCDVINGKEKDFNKKPADINTKIKALDTLNKMSGEYVTKVEGNMNVSYEESLKEVADTNEY